MAARPIELNVRIADFDADFRELREIRFQVFVDEQGVPEDIELDQRDEYCVHVLAVDGHGRAVGTARIDLGAGGQVGRLAVLAGYRRKGVGTALMSALHEIAIDNGLPGAWCHAQTAAAAFYAALGYTAEGQTFREAGIEHIRMALKF